MQTFLYFIKPAEPITTISLFVLVLTKRLSYSFHTVMKRNVAEMMCPNLHLDLDLKLVYILEGAFQV